MTTFLGLQDDKLPDEIYHYTDANGLLGILKAQKLWATHAAYLNDSEEVVQGIRMVRNVATALGGKLPSELTDEHLGKKLLLQFMARMFGAKLPEQVQEQMDSLIPRFGPFVTCFSEERDRLSQWRGYGRTAGYAIKFDGRKLREYILDHGAKTERSDETSEPLLVNRRTFVKMVYEPSELEHATQEHIAKLWDTIVFILKKLAAGDMEPPTESEIGDASEILPSLILTALRLKDKGFEEEKEYRMLVFANPDDFAATGRGLTPRVEIEFDPKCIKEVIVGPGPDRETRLSSVEYYKTVHSDYSEVEVTPSKIPFRGT